MTQHPCTAVIIPARNEEQRIGSCLSALATQAKDDVLIVVVANNCTDGTVRAARDVVPDDRLVILEVELASTQGVGSARQLGCLHALASDRGVTSVMTTDADCIVAPDWIAQNLRHLTEVDAVCGRIHPIASETAILAQMPSKEGWDEAIYRDLVLQFHDLCAQEPHNRYPHHGEAAGASLACRGSVWHDIGGFANLRSGEDREFVRRLRGAGYRVRHASDVQVYASCRLNGRAPGGMADALRERLAGVDYLVDEALPPVADLVAMTMRGRADAWPFDTAQANRLRPADLPAEILRLQALIKRMIDESKIVEIGTSVASYALPRIAVSRVSAPPDVQAPVDAPIRHREAEPGNSDDRAFS